MRSHVQALVIGGGVVGASVLYHLTRLGWTDVSLVERRDLTAGSTWHAAAGFHVLNSDINVARLQAYTIELYKRIEQESGQSVGMHLTGGLNIASTPERMESLRADWAKHRILGLDTELVSPAEIGELFPLVDTSKLLGGLYDRNEGHLDPHGVTHAYAGAARKLGAEIVRNNKVEELHQQADGSWKVVTEKGVIHTEHVINAAGLWAREVGTMAGVALPLLPMQHHYIVTGDIPELVDREKELPGCLDLDGEMYMRQEGNGVLLGIYEHNSKPWALEGTPWGYGETDLLPPDLERIGDSLMRGFGRFPSVEEAGIKRVVNGPFTFSPDGNPLVGPVPGVRNYWAACGVMAGFCQGGGIGLTLAQWMIEGEPHCDVLSMDIARYGDYANKAYTLAKVQEFYERRFSLSYPNEEWPSGRPAKITLVYQRLGDRNAVFGASYGQEYALYFAPEGEEPVETPTYRRSNAFGPVGEECRATRQHVAAIESSSFAKYLVSGPGAREWLDYMLASRLPTQGRVRLGVMLSPAGRLMGDLTVACVAPGRFMILGSGYLQSWHMRWFHTHLPDRDVCIRNVSDELQGFAIAGPKSRTLLERLTNEDVSGDALPFLSIREMDIGFAPATVARLSVTGELGFEIYVPAQYLLGLYEELTRTGQGLNLRLIGVRALLSLRLEKSFGIWSREFSPDYTPSMAGVGRFVDYEKKGFLGYDAAVEDCDSLPARRLVTLVIDAADADAHGYEPIWLGDKYVGFTTSGGYGHCVGKSLAMGYVDTLDFDDSQTYHVHVVGEKRSARVLKEAAFDPTGARMRA